MNNGMNNDKVLATVGGKPITEQNVTEMLLRMGQRAQSYNNPEGRAMILDQLIANQLLLIDANVNMIEREPAFKEQLRKVKEDMLINYNLTKVMEAVRVTEDDAKKYFDENKEKFVSGQTFNASHILVDSEEKAASLLAEIKEGKVSFADAAASHSSCPSGQNGGELGDFSSGQMVPEFEQACATMEIGAISEPVKTQFGWHIIKLNSRNEGGEMNFEEVKDQLLEALRGEKQQAAYKSKVNQLKILYPVEKMQ